MSQPNFSSAATISAEGLLGGELRGQQFDRFTPLVSQRRPFQRYLECWALCGTFSGRASRKEYWYFTLFNYWAIVVLALTDFVVFDSGKALLGPLSLIYYCVSAVPAMSVAVRRLHDIGKSGWVLLIGLIPIAGMFTLFAFSLQASEPRTNDYGAIPE